MLNLVQWSMSMNNGMKLREGKIGLNIKEKNNLTEWSITWWNGLSRGTMAGPWCCNHLQSPVETMSSSVDKSGQLT